MNSAVQIHIIVRNLPGNTFGEYQNIQLGIQRGGEIMDAISGASEFAEFHLELKVAVKADGFAWGGPFAHGTAGAKFLYLCWTAQKGETREMFRRAKIHLQTIPRELLETAIQEKRALKLELGMTDEKGGPLCASVARDKLLWS